MITATCNFPFSYVKSITELFEEPLYVETDFVLVLLAHDLAMILTSLLSMHTCRSAWSQCQKPQIALVCSSPQSTLEQHTADMHFHQKLTGPKRERQHGQRAI